MLAEPSIVPAGNELPATTCIEGDREEVVSLVRRRPERGSSHCSRVITSAKIEEEAGASDKLMANVASIEEKLGPPLHRDHNTRISARQSQGTTSPPPGRS